MDDTPVTPEQPSNVVALPERGSKYTRYKCGCSIIDQAVARCPTHDKGRSPGASPEYMKALALRSQQARLERVARGEEPVSTRGRVRRYKPLTAKEIRDAALKSAADLFADWRQDAVDVLVKQMSHKDPGIAQRAATKVLEYTDGKPTQTIVNEGANPVREVVYVTSALLPERDEDEFRPMALDA